MKFIEYLKDKKIFIFISLLTYILIMTLLLAFKVNQQLFMAVAIIMFCYFIFIITYDFFRKRQFYLQLLKNVEKLDKSYYVLETLHTPNFYEGKLLCTILYDINKSMIENVKKHEIQVNEFKEYVELWIHEIKIPIASLVLIMHNHKNNFDQKIIKQVNRIEDYVDQVLYYVRSENPEKDYLIKQINLKKIINKVALKNKDYLLESKIDFISENTDVNILTDSKWLEFILNQIINNAIKYKKPQHSYIKITTHDTKDSTILTIEDNGIGICKNDLPRIFDKSFTGKNGRITGKSTGMGLFITKKLCHKLGHQIIIESKENVYTKVSIIISKDRYFNVIS